MDTIRTGFLRWLESSEEVTQSRICWVWPLQSLFQIKMDRIPDLFDLGLLNRSSHWKPKNYGFCQNGVKFRYSMCLQTISSFGTPRTTSYQYDLAPVWPCYKMRTIWTAKLIITKFMKSLRINIAEHSDE